MMRPIIGGVFVLVMFAVFATAQDNELEVVPPNLLPELLALNGDLETRQQPKYLSPAALAASAVTLGLFILVAKF